jgi:hypothetical protein
MAGDSQAMDRRSIQALRRFTALFCAALLALQTGCHAFLPLQETAPSSGQTVSVVLNDRGRVMMAGRLGEMVDRIEGRLVQASDSSVSIEVSRVVTLQGSTSVWTGERIDVPRGGVRGFQRRGYSSRRTMLLVLGMVAGIAAIAATISLDVFGDGKPGDGGSCAPPDCPDQ